MKKFQTILAAVLCAAVLGGCSTKRQYFEPTDVQNEKISENRLPSSIATASLNGAVLKNGMVITKSGLLAPEIKLPKGSTLLNYGDGKFISSDLNGNLIVENSSNEILFQRSFDQAVVSAALEGDKLAALTASNVIYLIDISTNEVLLEFESSNVYAQDSRVAAPLFMSSLVIFPTLDGKIMIVDKSQGRILRDVIVSSEQFFNNVISLNVVNDTMIAATGKRIVSINPEKTVYFNGEIKDVVINGEHVYILLKDGKIVLSDLNLKKIKDAYFKFAIFSSATVYNGSLYIMEKTGYLIKTDLALDNAKIYELSDEVESQIFAGSKEFYYDDYSLELK
ncbi:L-seryl-tRNA selenium transferase [uncultured Campylobacter sp.]|uniref:L-seryl-tRNA selenium transferase n=1 Tax=uncultured Campylobacter sp. TaxID=218934 RepID=UPI0028EDA3B1|nr:L-seryl-tRNA selenium transferase [uncultured Campylobacter sp.]